MVKKISSAWVASGEVCKSLGFKPKHLWKLRDDGSLREGTHWRNIASPHAARPTYRWHLDRIRKLLETRKEER
ncbi:DNA-binding protein [Microcoleus sp. FACHB-1515]|uniref:DNA-binding protein n=1 Tax=Cyanophyceae TaxID=3028117 RepID=UPI001686A8FE|nr:DNA-binding protein [Microcoleus sp. FACHB-1515]MBD2088367.1 DNA-binding protein [Microcoleus sp. FACHB-1515]